MSDDVGAVVAKLAEAQRLQAEAISELARTLETKQPSEWVSQKDSPLGSRAHRELARAGAFPSSRIGKLVLVRRADIDAYIASNRVPRRERDVKPANDVEDLDDQLEQIAARAKRRRAR